MSLLVIPSIDIKDGKTVRVVQGIPELDCKEYGSDPVEMALIWRAENAKLIHVVDFNCSQEHSHCNFNIIQSICDSVIIPVEFGGGISSLDEAKKVMDLGIYRLIIGSLAYLDPKEFEKILNYVGPQKIAAAIDVEDDRVIIRGRSELTDISPLDYAKRLESIGVNRCIVTDVKRNGMLDGPNIELSKLIATETNLNITHSGGIGGYQDLIKINEVVSLGIDSAIIGRALYENKFPCQKIWRKAENGLFS